MKYSILYNIFMIAVYLFIWDMFLTGEYYVQTYIICYYIIGSNSIRFICEQIIDQIFPAEFEHYFSFSIKKSRLICLKKKKKYSAQSE